jgi:predicted nucleotidyltransferase
MREISPHPTGLPEANPRRALTPSSPQLLEQRRQEALAVAQQCEVILRDRFHAKQVILFGSLSGESPWHQDSDLDLAVAGLSHAEWLKTYDELGAIAPPWLKIDLVRLESLYPEVRACILREKPMPSNPYLALKERLQDELVALERNAAALETALEHAKTNLDEYDVRALASYIDDFYKRCERMSERVVVSRHRAGRTCTCCTYQSASGSHNVYSVAGSKSGFSLIFPGNRHDIQI